ncbi:MAG: integrase [Ruminococcaceae bacterium]|nr:integrase [Oscillospiraceae bacterium]
MKEKRITKTIIEKYCQHLKDDEKSSATVAKYMRDVCYFAAYAKDRIIDKSLTLAYKAELTEKYTVSSANSMLAAMNSFLRFAGWQEFCVKQYRVQKKVYCSIEKELGKDEYIRLIQTAESKGNDRLSLVIQCICATGIRVSELRYITVEALKSGRADVSCKGKTRTVFLVGRLRKKLLMYVKKENIASGEIFVTKTGKTMNRSNIWREMKALCDMANVLPDKVFPHNLRHLFAKTFYTLEKDIAKLADILGHANINTTRIYIMTTGAEHIQKLENMQLVT